MTDDLRTKALREQLAAIEHARWASWQEWMHRQCLAQPDGSLIIPAEWVQRWGRQIATPYADLSQGEQDSDRAQVDRYWLLIGPALEQATAAITAYRAAMAAQDDDGFVDGTPWVDWVDAMESLSDALEGRS